MDISKDEIIEIMARGVLIRHWLDAGCGIEDAIHAARTQETFDGEIDIGDDWTIELCYQRAALAALETAGYVVVPKEPTDKMCDAGEGFNIRCGCASCDHSVKEKIAEGWKSMITASIRYNKGFI